MDRDNNGGSVVVEVAVLVAFVAFMVFYAIPNRTIDTPTEPQASPIAQRPIPQGIQTYEIVGDFTGPVITELTVDPLDAKVGQTQNLSVKVSDTIPVSSVEVTITLDNNSKANTAELQLAEGTDVNGVWGGSVEFPNDTLKLNYTVTVIAISANGTSKIVTTVR